MSSATSMETTSERIPIIDVGPFRANVHDAAEALASEVVRTCLDTGFLVITNYGVPQGIIDRAFDAAGSFFALDEASKFALKVGSLRPRGRILIHTGDFDRRQQEPGEALRVARMADQRLPDS